MSDLENAESGTNVKVAFAAGSDEVNPRFLEHFADVRPELELYVVSEFPPGRGHWIPYRIGRTLRQNLAYCRAVLKNKRIVLAAVVLQPQMPLRRMRLLPLLLAPLHTLFYNENLDHFVLRPRSARTIAKHFAWRAKNFLRWQFEPGGHLYTFAWRLLHPAAFRRPLLYRKASAIGWILAARKRAAKSAALELRADPLPEGISVVVPSRQGKQLLAALLPGVIDDLAGIPSEIIVVDNGSEDGSAEWMQRQFPQVIIDVTADPLSFARAVNRGIQRARFSHVCLLNNDMEIEPGFFRALRTAFDKVPELFCATAQIFFPPGQRRQETGKAFLSPEAQWRAEDGFPVHCAEPLPNEDLTYVLYGSGGCSLFSTNKLRSLGSVGEVYAPAYVEDLDLGVRGWKQGWPSVFVARASVMHHHRATTSRYYGEHELSRILDTNYLRFLARTIDSPHLFRKLWSHALRRLNRMSAAGDLGAEAALESAQDALQWIEPSNIAVLEESHILALNSGEVAVFPGCSAIHETPARPRVLIVSPYLPFPLAHGGAVRMYNLMKRAAANYDLILITFVDELQSPARELLDICAEVVEVRRSGAHDRPLTDRPDVVEEFDSAGFHAALRQTVRKWRPQIAQLEFTQMAQYAADCGSAKTILIEHDITLDLYQQLLAQSDNDWEVSSQLKRWQKFETTAWSQVDCVVTMSAKDLAAVTGARRSVAIANGVDLDRFRPSGSEPENGRLLFIGSFGHLPNVLALDFFLREVWPLLQDAAPVLHVIGGARPDYFLGLYKNRVQLNLKQPGIELEGFVSDVRPAYERASVVIAPLLASAGTNIKIMEAMAMGKAVVSTPAGINGLELEDGRDVLVGATAHDFASAALSLISNAGARKALEAQARATVERYFSWDKIAAMQDDLYRALLT